LQVETFYNPFMLDENDFRRHADAALESLKQSLITAEESADFEVEDQSGALHISFEDGSRFVISPNAPVRQIAGYPGSARRGGMPRSIMLAPHTGC